METILLGIFVVFFLLFFLYCYCIVLGKAGESAISGIIPIYSTYLYYEIVGKAEWFTYLIMCVVGSVVTSTFASIFNSTILSLLFLLLSLGLEMGAFILNILMQYYLSKAFGHGVGFALGLIFLPFIFFAILAIGSSEYQGYYEDGKYVNRAKRQLPSERFEFSFENNYEENIYVPEEDVSKDNFSESDFDEPGKIDTMEVTSPEEVSLHETQEIELETLPENHRNKFNKENPFNKF